MKKIHRETTIFLWLENYAASYFKSVKNETVKKFYSIQPNCKNKGTILLKLSVYNLFLHAIINQVKSTRSMLHLLINDDNFITIT